MAIVYDSPLDATVPDPEPTLCTAETADCTCPEFCERDHDVD
jgi:hypothetical protein